MVSGGALVSCYVLILTLIRTFVVENFWPKGNVTVDKVRSSYQRMLLTELGGKKKTVSQTNGS